MKTKQMQGSSSSSPSPPSPPSPPPYLKTTWRMPTSLMKQLQHIAIDQDTTTTNIMIEAAREYIEKRGKAENK